MLKIEIIGDRTHTYSDEGYKIRKIETGEVYEDAMDIVPCPYTYEETDEKIVEEETGENV